MMMNADFSLSVPLECTRNPSKNRNQVSSVTKTKCWSFHYHEYHDIVLQNCRSGVYLDVSHPSHWIMIIPSKLSSVNVSFQVSVICELRFRLGHCVYNRITDITNSVEFGTSIQKYLLNRDIWSSLPVWRVVDGQNLMQGGLTFISMASKVFSSL